MARKAPVSKGVKLALAEILQRWPKTTAGAALVELERRQPPGWRPDLDERTIQKHLKQLREAAEIKVWSWGATRAGFQPADAPPAAIATWALLMAERANKETLMLSAGPPVVTEREMFWVKEINKVAPDIGPSDLAFIAGSYVLREWIASAEGKEPDYADLDLFLSLGPWRDEECFRRYYTCLRGGTSPVNDAVMKSLFAGSPLGLEESSPQEQGEGISVQNFLEHKYPHLLGLLPSQVHRMAELVQNPPQDKEALPWPDRLLWPAAALRKEAKR